jgi:hypothetical protein
MVEGIITAGYGLGKRALRLRPRLLTRNGRLIGSPKGVNKDCTTVTAAPVLPAGYVVSASRIADRRMILAIPLEGSDATNG